MSKGWALEDAKQLGAPFPLSEGLLSRQTSILGGC